MSGQSKLEFEMLKWFDAYCELITGRLEQTVTSYKPIGSKDQILDKMQELRNLLKESPNE